MVVRGERVGGGGALSCCLGIGRGFTDFATFTDCVLVCWKWAFWCRVCRYAAVAWGLVFANVRGFRECG